MSMFFRGSRKLAEEGQQQKSQSETALFPSYSLENVKTRKRNNRRRKEQASIEIDKSTDTLKSAESNAMDVDLPSLLSVQINPPEHKDASCFEENDNSEDFDSKWQNLKARMLEQRQEFNQRAGISILPDNETEQDEEDEEYDFASTTTPEITTSFTHQPSSSSIGENYMASYVADSDDDTNQDAVEFESLPSGNAVESQLELEICADCGIPLTFANLYGAALTCMNESCDSYMCAKKAVIHPSSAHASTQYISGAHGDDDDAAGGNTIIATSFNSSFASNHVAFMGHYTKTRINIPSLHSSTGDSSSLALSSSNSTAISSPPHQQHADVTFTQSKRVWPHQNLVDYIALCIRLSTGKTRQADITIFDVCACTKVHGWKELYKENAIQVFCRITSAFPPHLTPKQKQQTNKLFDQLYHPYALQVQQLHVKLTKGPSRLKSVDEIVSMKKHASNRINHVFLWFRVYQMTKNLHMLKFLKLPATRDTLAVCIEAFDQIMMAREGDDDELKVLYLSELRAQNKALFQQATQSITITPLIGIGTEALAKSKLDIVLNANGELISIALNGEDIDIPDFGDAETSSTNNIAAFFPKPSPIPKPSSQKKLNIQPITMSESELLQRMRHQIPSSSSLTSSANSSFF